jgi:ergothioneine biosynthesis protein EgtB
LPGLIEQYRATREATLSLVAPLSAEDCAIQSMPDASPAKWHLAHTTWFFETFVLEPHAPGYRAFDASYRYLFNSYYNAIGERHPRPERGMLSRPSLDEVLAYRRYVDEALLELRELDTGARALVELGVHHEQQHQELLLTDVKHMLSRNPLKPAYQKQWPLTPIRARAPRWVGFGGGLYEIGHAGAGFAFDNETPRHRVWLEDFEVASHPVTHGDFLEFIDDGGYRRAELWLSAGWEVVRTRVGSTRVLGAARRPLVHLHAARRGAGGSEHADLPRQLLRGGSVRALVESASAWGGRVGDRRPRRAQRGEFPGKRGTASARAARGPAPRRSRADLR